MVLWAKLILYPLGLLALYWYIQFIFVMSDDRTIGKRLYDLLAKRYGPRPPDEYEPL